MSDTFILTRDDGTTLRFAHLSLYDIFGNPDDPKWPNGIMPKIRRAHLAKLREALEIGGLTREEIANELAAECGREPSFDDFRAFAGTPVGRTYVIGHAFAKANGGDAKPPPLFDAEWKQVRDAVFGSAGIVFVDEAAEADAGDPEPTEGGAAASATYGDGGTDPNPPAPETYSATPGVLPETGSSTGA